jgi:hypothetical protein
MVIYLVDDVDQAEGVETAQFALDGIRYEIDLSAAHGDELRATLAPRPARARRVGGASKLPPRRRRASRADEKVTRIRQWARTQGYPVPDRGRIPDGVLVAYADAH